MYSLIQGIAILVYLAFFTFYGKKFKLSIIKSFILAVVGMIIYLVLVKFLGWASTGFKSLGPENGIRVYFFLPVFIYLLAKVSNVEPLKLFDMQAAPCVLMYGVSHLACVFEGCCQGYQYFEGTTMYNIAMALTGTNMLPVQLGESISALIVFGIVFYFTIKNNYHTNGRLFVLWYVLFGFERFLWEFLRDNYKIIEFWKMSDANGYFGISELAIWSLLMFIAGVGIYFIIRHVEKKNTQSV